MICTPLDRWLTRMELGTSACRGVWVQRPLGPGVQDPFLVDDRSHLIEDAVEDMQYLYVGEHPDGVTEGWLRWREAASSGLLGVWACRDRETSRVEHVMLLQDSEDVGRCMTVGKEYLYVGSFTTG